MNRARTVAGVSLMGTFMCGLFTCQALPLLAPFQAAQEYGIALLFLGALATGFLFGMLSPSIAYGVFAGFASIVLGLVLAGFMLALPALLGIAGQLSIMSEVAFERALILGIMLTPISAVGTFIGVLAQNHSI
ncbi:MAG TPA: hypothetical protein GX721_02800 [Firmicutes bacterium]|jgi:hypothetical protein|nr:hypothetical protein [Bacillota bacterium]